MKKDNPTTQREETVKNAFYNRIAMTSDAPMGLEIASAEGPFLKTITGKKYVDFISGIAVSSLGHRHPNVIAAIQEQLNHHLHVMVYGEFIQRPQSLFADLLTSQLPEQLDRVYFVNSGTEAIEGALKLAKKYTGRSEFVSFENSYHGDTQGSLSVTGRDIYRNPYEPLLPGVTFLNFNDDSDLDQITEQTAAVILEPIQGEGGIIPAEEKWLKSVRQRCDETGALLIFDEIQSGFGRTGKLFAFEHYGVVPDILCMAKAMGGGMPIGGFASSSKIFETFKFDPPLNHVTTFGGHPVSCAAGYANLKTILEENLIDRAPYIEEKIRTTLEGKPGVIEIRGKGAMLGMELKDKDFTQKVVEICMEEGVILGWTLHSNTLVRLAPPLIIDDETLDWTLGVIGKALETVRPDRF
jgi:acetylornithine/succinyldiaminopimelate/putrescine aminotransferase